MKPALAFALGFLTALVFAAGATATGAQPQPPTPPVRSGAIEGIALDASGRPVEGALVAAVSENTGTDELSTRAAAFALTAKDGRYVLSPLPKGPYSVTATKRGLAAAYVGGRSVKEGETLRGVELRLGGAGIAIRGLIRDRRGAPMPGAQVRALRYSDQLGDIFYVNADEAGRYEITLPKAGYLLAVPGKGGEFTTVGADSSAEQVVDVRVYATVPPGPPPAAVVDWIRANAVPLRTVEAEHGFADLEPLRASIGDARVVALGEATHGTRDFFQLKHRVLEFLVARMGFNVFAIEASMPEAFDVNDYVLTGRGDPEKALAGLYFWTWDTEEVLDLIRWMRRWNADPAHKAKVKFYGVDMQTRARATKRVLHYLRLVDPAEAARAERSLRPIARSFREERFFRLEAANDPAAAAVDSAVAVLAKAFDGRRAEYIRRTSDEAWALARQHLRIVEQGAALGGGPDFTPRDRAMAENVRWILRREGPRAKMVLWAHNGHVSKAEPGAGAGGMGHFLRQALGRDLVVFGFAFDRGSFQALDGASIAGRELARFTVGPSREGSLDDAFHRTGLPVAALDLRHLPGTGPVGDWFTSMIPTRDVGSVFVDSAEARYYKPIVPVDHYDAILFVDSTSAVRRNPRGERPPVVVLAAPRNLDFEEGAVGAAPAGWEGPSRLAADHYRAEVAPEGARPGSRCAGIRSVRGTLYGEVSGILAQSVDARPYAGKRVRLRAAVRVEPGPGGGDASLSIAIFRGRGGFQGPAYADDTDIAPAAGREWREVAVEGTVPDNATRIDYRLVFEGEGSAWIDSVSLDVVDPAR